MHLHDRRVVSYEVFCEERKIVLHLVYRDAGEPFEYGEVTFLDVVAYDLHDDGVFGSILFGIDEVEASKIYKSATEALQRGVKWGWVGEWANTAESAVKFFQDSNLRGFEVSATLGLKGWIIAKSMDTRVSQKKIALDGGF